MLNVLENESSLSFDDFLKRLRRMNFRGFCNSYHNKSIRNHRPIPPIYLSYRYSIYKFSYYVIFDYNLKIIFITSVL